MPDRKSTVKLSSKLTLDWKVDKINPALAAAKAGEHRSIKTSEYYDTTDGWDLDLVLGGADAEEGYAAVYIHARETSEDRKRVTATKSWSFAVPLELSDHGFEKSDSWGFPSALPFAALEQDRVKEPNGFLLRCSIEGRAPSEELTYLQRYGSRDAPTLEELYEDTEHTDVVFRLQDSADSKPIYLFGLKKLLKRRCYHFGDLFESGFSESNKAVEVDLQALLTRPLHPFEGDGDDFAAFEAALPPSALEDPPVDPEEPWYFRRSECPLPSREPSPCPQVAVAGPDTEEGAVSSERPQKKRRTGSTRKVAQIDIEDCSFATLDAFLFYLYTDKTQFLPSVSNFLVAFHNRKTKSASRNVWLTNQKHFSPAQVCLPHALYRLADRYLASSLKKLAKEFIVRSLTSENVAYEVFCQLSIDFEDFRKPVLDFLVDHWDEVKSTKAMKEVLTLLDAGSLPGGGEILGKILVRLTKAPEKEDKGKDRA